MKKRIWQTSAVFVIAVILSYQNCSNVNFSGNQVQNDAYGNPTSGPIDPSTVSTTNFSCQQYVTLQPVSSGPITIPTRDSSGTCYIMKVISAAQFDPSSSNPNSDAEVISRNHDIDASNSYDTHHPYTLGTAQVRILMQGARAISLSGGPDNKTNILVDNFILVGISATTDLEDPNDYHAYGTSDSTVNGTNDVLFKGQPVGVQPFATGGTSTVTPLALQGQINLGQDDTLDLRALDCGAVGVVSDIYLIFQ